jgi:hypothetical protein
MGKWATPPERRVWRAAKAARDERYLLRGLSG